MPHERFGDGGWGGGDAVLPLLGMLVPLVFLAGLALLAFLLLRGRLAPVLGRFDRVSFAPAPPPADPALALLRDRYARGEIDTAEYEERRQRLLGEHGNL